VTTINSLDPVVAHFNTKSDKLRFISILSSTCGGCVYGAQSIRDGLLKAFPDADIDVTIIWADMLAPDGKDTVQTSSAIFDDPRVTQFYDPERVVGTAIRNHVFPDSIAQMKSSLDPDHVLMPKLRSGKRMGPEWDIYMFYTPGTTWEEAPPAPATFLRQVIFYGTEGNGPTGLLWKDSYANTPIESDLELEIHEIAKKLLPEPVSETRIKAGEEEVIVMDGNGNIFWRGKVEDLPKEFAAKQGDEPGGNFDTDDTFKDGQMPVVTQLKGDIDSLRTAFNADRGTRRFLALLSPTCPACLAGGRAIRDELLAPHDNADVKVTIVWIDMLPTDNHDSAMRAAQMFHDPRVTQFYDPDQIAGDIVGRTMLNPGAGSAWDIYLFYDEVATWNDSPPEPVEWCHQLSGTRRADPERFFSGKALADQIHELTHRWLGISQATLDDVTLIPAKLNDTPKVELLAIDSCPLSGTLRTRLQQSLERCGIACTINDVNLAALPENDARRCFGSPTVLYSGKELFGCKPSNSKELTCRIYSGGDVPSVDELCAAISSWIAARESATQSASRCTPGSSCCSGG